MLKSIPLLAISALATACSTLSGDYGMVVEAITLSRKQVELPTFANGLNSKYRYLAVRPANAPAAVFVLGFDRDTPEGLLEVWYSADGVMLQTLNGRMAGSRGYPVQWASVSWAKRATSLVRARDDLSAGVFGVVDLISSQPVKFENVPDLAWAQWPVSPSSVSQLNWMHDTISTTPASLSPGNGWVAHGKHRGYDNWVLSYQCLSPGMCFHFARLPLELNSPPQ